MSAGSSQENSDVEERRRRRGRRHRSQRLVEDCDPITLKRWNESEKEKLYLMLHKFGDKNYKRIAQEIPTKTARDVFYAVRYWKREANKLNALNMLSMRSKGNEKLKVRTQSETAKSGLSAKCNNKRLAGIELWINSFTDQMRKCGNEGSMDLVPVVKMIAHFEALPTVEEADGVDFKELYLWLAEMLAGQPLRSLSVATADFLAECTKELTRTSTDNWPRLRAAIERIICNVWCPENVRSYGAKKKEDTQAGKRKDDIQQRMQNVLSKPGLNPIGLDKDRLTKKQLAQNIIPDSV